MGGRFRENSEPKMKHRVTIRPEAENDLKEAFSWYEDKKQGLGMTFFYRLM